MATNVKRCVCAECPWAWGYHRLCRHTRAGTESRRGAHEGRIRGRGPDPRRRGVDSGADRDPSDGRVPRAPRKEARREDGLGSQEAGAVGGRKRSVAAAPNLGVGGSHSQAATVQAQRNAGPPATVNPFFGNTSSLPAGQSFSSCSGRFRGGQPRSATQAQEAAAMADETLSSLVKTTDKDGVRMRSKLTGMKLEDLRREDARRRNNSSKARRRKRGKSSADGRRSDRRRWRNSSRSSSIRYTYVVCTASIKKSKRDNH